MSSHATAAPAPRKRCIPDAAAKSVQTPRPLPHSALHRLHTPPHRDTPRTHLYWTHICCRRHLCPAHVTHNSRCRRYPKTLCTPTATTWFPTFAACTMDRTHIQVPRPPSRLSNALLQSLRPSSAYSSYDTASCTLDPSPHVVHPTNDGPVFDVHSPLTARQRE